MQSWTHHSTRCLFCQFRQSISHSRLNTGSRVRLHREFTSLSTISRNESRRHSTEDRVKDFDKRVRQHEKHIKARRSSESRLVPLGAKDSPRRPFRGGAPVSNSDHRGEPLQSLDMDVKKSMAVVKSRLSIVTPAKDDAPPQPAPIQILDPDGTLWSAFRDHVLTAPTRITGKSDATATDLWNRLTAARFKSKADLDSEIHFEFLDFAFKSIKRAPESESGLTVDLRYPTEWYSAARKQQRVIHLHVGPTNSGKTYNALKRLQETRNGFYAGPLRLLAHEVYSRFRANGIPCDLVTGDDVRLDDDFDTMVYASTVEMIKLSAPVEVAVIDEIQMMGEIDRGWAWTRAFLGTNAKEVHLCGETRVVPLIRELSASMGDTLHIHHYERLNPLRTANKSLRGNLKSLRKGDCIVAFSIMQIHALRKQIEVETGRRCAIVYGSLPPETRAEQADLFNNPDNDYDFLVASDAIGMGLNLSIKRIIFNSVHKFDGIKRVQLTVPQIKQIAGRAGRYRSAHDDKTRAANPLAATKTKTEENIGLVTCLDEADLPIIESALRAEAPPLRRAGIIPPAEFLEQYSRNLPISVPFEYLLRKVSAAATLHPRFFQCDLRNRLFLARIIDDVKGLTIEQRVNITAAPSSRNNPMLTKCFRAMAKAIAEHRSVDITELREIPLELLAQTPTADRSYLEALESLHSCLIQFLWLGYRFMQNLRDRDMATHAKTLVEQRINWTLRAFSANPKLRQRLKQIQMQQEHLVEESFTTGPVTPGEAQSAKTEAQAYQPAEAYEAEAVAEAEAEAAAAAAQGFDDVHPQLGEFGNGEAGLDIGPGTFGPPEGQVQQNAHRTRITTGESTDDIFAGDSILDIAHPNPAYPEDSPQPSDESQQEMWAGDSVSEPVLTLSDAREIDAEVENQPDANHNSADEVIQSHNSARALGEAPTAKVVGAESLDPNALSEEIREDGRLRGAAGQ